MPIRQADMKRIDTLSRHSLFSSLRCDFPKRTYAKKYSKEHIDMVLAILCFASFNVCIRFRKKKGRDYANSQQDYRSEQQNSNQDQFCRSFPTARCDKSRKEKKLQREEPRLAELTGITINRERFYCRMAQTKLTESIRR